jgi:transposase
MAMRDRELYATILGIRSPWLVTEVELDAVEEEVRVRIEFEDGAVVTCPECGSACPCHDHRTRTWRHLDTCQYRTVLSVRVPRARCDQHGVHQIRVPWGEPGSGFTALFEALTIDWLKEANIKAVARRLRLSWDQVDGIRARAVRRGLARRGREEIRRIGVDETSFQKRHEYVTTVCDLERPRVLHVADGRGREALEGFYGGFSVEELGKIEAVAMDMWEPYIGPTLEHVPGAEGKIAFDRYHVARQLVEAVNDVRKQEHRELRAEGDERLSRSKYLWLQNPENMTPGRRARFNDLRRSNLKVARAWAIKETARNLWGYMTRGWARRAWKRWLGWALRSRLEPIRRAARMIRKYLWGILNAIVLKVTNASTESLNAKIQWVKKNACGFRNRDRFREAIYFHCGDLNLYPEMPATHTIS